MILPLCTPLDPAWFRLSYRGESMWGTFQPGDILWISRFPYESLQVGDVVAFGARGKSIAHRIVGREGVGFRTQGDGNRSRDALELMPADLIGKVVARERRGIRLVVAGGIAGRRRAAVLGVLGVFRSLVGGVLAPPYRAIRASQRPSRLWRPRITTARFATRAGITTKFIHRGKTVASWAPDSSEWICRKPFDLVLSPPSR